MKTTWEWSKESEANRILQAAHNIGNGFYSLNNFGVCSSTDPYTPTSVNIPSLNYAAIREFWLRLREVDSTSLPASDPTNLAHDLLPHLDDCSQPDMTALQTLWDQHADQLIDLVQDALPRLQLPDHLVIYLTRFGTIGSFGNYNQATEDHLTIFLRQDASLDNLVYCLLAALLRPIHKQDGLTWSESQAILDHLISQSQLGKYLDTISPRNPTQLVTALRQRSRLPTSSKNFLQQIGAPQTDLSQPLHNLTAREQKILNRLIELQGKTLIYDDLADLIFDDEEGYSLTVMGKVIERLRAKLEQNGITGSVVATDRARGYYLKS